MVKTLCKNCYCHHCDNFIPADDIQIPSLLSSFPQKINQYESSAKTSINTTGDENKLKHQKQMETILQKVRAFQTFDEAITRFTSANMEPHNYNNPSFQQHTDNHNINSQRIKQLISRPSSLSSRIRRSSIPQPDIHNIQPATPPKKTFLRPYSSISQSHKDTSTVSKSKKLSIFSQRKQSFIEQLKKESIESHCQMQNPEYMKTKYMNFVGKSSFVPSTPKDLKESIIHKSSKVQEKIITVTTTSNNVNELKRGKSQIQSCHFQDNRCFGVDLKADKAHEFIVDGQGHKAHRQVISKMSKMDKN